MSKSMGAIAGLERNYESFRMACDLQGSFQAAI